MPRPSEEPNPNPRTFSEAVGAEIRRRRLKKKLSAEECAGLAKMPTPSWYHAESGKVSLDRLPAIAKALACPVRSLLPAEWPG